MKQFLGSSERTLLARTQVLLAQGSWSRAESPQKCVPSTCGQEQGDPGLMALCFTRLNGSFNTH